MWLASRQGWDESSHHPRLLRGAATVVPRMRAQEPPGNVNGVMDVAGRTKHKAQSTRHKALGSSPVLHAVFTQTVTRANRGHPRKLDEEARQQGYDVARLQPIVHAGISSKTETERQRCRATDKAAFQTRLTGPAGYGESERERLAIRQQQSPPYASPKRVVFRTRGGNEPTPRSGRTQRTTPLMGNGGAIFSASRPRPKLSTTAIPLFEVPRGIPQSPETKLTEHRKTRPAPEQETPRCKAPYVEGEHRTLDRPSGLGQEPCSLPPLLPCEPLVQQRKHFRDVELDVLQVKVFLVVLLHLEQVVQFEVKLKQTSVAA